MNFRIPSLAAIIALFFPPRTVAGAMADVSRANGRLQNVIEHNQRQGERAEVERLACIARAAESASRRDTHAAQADRARRVSIRLDQLLA